MPAHILHVIPAIAPRYGGPSIAAVGMCRALRASGTETLVATTDADGESKLSVSTGCVTSYEGAPAILFSRQASESFKWSAPLAAWLRDHVCEFDLVHVHAVFSHSSLAAGRACRRAGVPYVVRPLGTLDPWSLDRHPHRKRLLLALGARRFLTGAAAMHYTTPEEQRLAEKRLPWLRRGAVVPLGIDPEFFEAVESSTRARAPIVLSMGRLHAKKGVELLIHACHSLARSGALDSWRLVIAGDGEASYVSELKRLAGTGPACDRIEFRGWVDGTARAALLQSARLFAMPSHQENFGIALVEALACGVPVVVTPGVNLATELATAGAGWVSDRTVEALTATLGQAMRDPSELDQRGRRARDFAQRFTWPRVAEALNGLYDGVISARASACGRISTSLQSPH